MIARYSGQSATVIGVATILLGFAAIGLGWVGAAANPFIPTQIAYAVSGGLTGIALIGTGAAVLNAQCNRILTAERAYRLDRLIDGSVDVLTAVRPELRRPGDAAGRTRATDDR